MAQRVGWHKTRFPIRRFLVVGLVAVVVGVSVAQADEPGPVAPGPRVRLTAPSVSGKRLVGTVVGLDEATLTLQRQGAKETLQVPRGAITTIEVSQHRSRKRKSAGIGALVGLGAAVAIGLAAGDDCGPIQGDDLVGRLARNLCYGKGETAAIVGILTVPAGALLGLAVAPGEKWVASTPDRLRVSVVPVRGGAGLTVSLRF